MKKIIPFLIILLFTDHLFGKCISGNCEDGHGSAEYDGYKYVGGFKDSKMHGRGVLQFPDGKFYVGPFINNEIIGEGVLTWPDSMKYVGGFKDSKMHGQGTLKSADGRDYSGKFSFGQIIEGSLVWPDGKRYVGEFKDFMMHGQGLLKYLDGSEYEGKFSKNQLSIGTFTWPDGKIYVGSFRDNNMHGKGSLKWPSGSLYEGYFDNGSMNGRGELIRDDGSRYVGTFKDNIPILGAGIDYLYDGRRLIYLDDRTELRDRDGHLIRSSLTNQEVVAVRGESAEKKRQDDEQLANKAKEDKRRLNEQRQYQKKLVTAIQKMLIDNLYLSGSPDGIFGKNTLKAVREFYEDANLMVPDLSSFDEVAKEIESNYLKMQGDCPYKPSSVKFTMCFSIVN